MPGTDNRPTADDIRANLEGYGITDSIISDTWITNKRDKIVIPFINKFIRNSLLTEETVVELYSGNGSQSLILNRRYINEITDIQLVSIVPLNFFLSPQSVVLLSKEGILKIKAIYTTAYSLYNSFPKGENNIQITYTYGFNGVIPDDIVQAIIMLTNIEMLTLISSSTGGGDLTTQGFSRSYGELGKYTNYIKKLTNSAYGILRDYTTMVAGA